jgi:hypothetical protein
MARPRRTSHQRRASHSLTSITALPPSHPIKEGGDPLPEAITKNGRENTGNGASEQGKSGCGDEVFRQASSECEEDDWRDEDEPAPETKALLRSIWPMPICHFRLPNGRRVSGERRAEGDERVRCTRVLGRGDSPVTCLPLALPEPPLPSPAARESKTPSREGLNYLGEAAFELGHPQPRSTEARTTRPRLPDFASLQATGVRRHEATLCRQHMMSTLEHWKKRS